MKTISFIGSDKNAGKTTAMLYVYRMALERSLKNKPVCLASIGINGESVDAYENRAKPSITIMKGSLFVTTGEHVSHLTGQYSVLDTIAGSGFSKSYVLARALTDFSVVLEGPNDRNGVLKMKEAIDQTIADCTCLIDGSIDRQFIGHPLVSDSICFALLLSNRKEQLTKAQDLLQALTLKKAPEQIVDIVAKYEDVGDKSLLIAQNGEVLYQSAEVPFLDQSLREICLIHKNASCTLYLKGSMTRSLHSFFAAFRNLTIVLDNFTLYQNISTRSEATKSFLPDLTLYHSVPLHSLFLKQETLDCPLRLPVEVPVYNLFRENPHAIGI